MKMRQRRRMRHAHQMLGLRIEQILADLEQACDLLLDALESGDVAAAIRADDGVAPPAGVSASPAASG